MPSKTGIVFDIQRFSLHDGPGIRTTVFLKGCPLDCKWCHNPEAKSYIPQLSFDAEKCKNCFECVNACPNNVHQIVESNHVVMFDECKLAGECIAVCPTSALEIIGINNTADEIIEIVLKDLDYYKNSNGGVTISGGEPMAQFNLTKELLVRLKELKIHTAIETCGYSPTKKYAEILHLVDLFLFDFKETDEERHKLYTGVDNKLIRENLEFLLDNNAEVILRCPLIPGVNDNENHFKGIAELNKKHPNLKRIEIMAYHNAGFAKSKKIGLAPFDSEIPTADENQKQKWLNSFKALGVENVSIG
ncbi:MAG: glycyl-radical enzyme activating protein [Melioribacteraceae bacterium]|nr:glycyl-radical enzyme activating protein [Melioribacteraceae bacterium]MCF8353544.1 glycyl-radical enzyme activating protein [Melioribacteraceae bacterium]MCF8392522.1 glycyl-radical enzyme activating protein [Melioribacteraceae bacterium]MCF8418463.1 glycyl-radical enzyme activating protein [Melioribacteraceae bacterium]